MAVFTIHYDNLKSRMCPVFKLLGRGFIENWIRIHQEDHSWQSSHFTTITSNLACAQCLNFLAAGLLKIG